MNIQLVLKKEDIKQNEIDDQKIAVVFDVLFATTTITACLNAGAEAVIPVINAQEAREKHRAMNNDQFCIAGEYNGALIDGFLTPAPYALSKLVKGKKVILSTTNGTVAIRRASRAKTVYAASLLNTKAVVKRIVETYAGETIIVICAGSANRFNLEDFYGTGYFISTLLEVYKSPTVGLSDSAKAAKLFYEKLADEGEGILLTSHVGEKLNMMGYGSEVAFSSQKSTLSVVPQLIDGQLRAT